MENKAADLQVPVGAETTDSVKSGHTNKDGKKGLPSPPSSVGATELDSGRKPDGSLSAEVAGNGGANAGIRKTAALIEVQADSQKS